MFVAPEFVYIEESIVRSILQLASCLRTSGALYVCAVSGAYVALLFPEKEAKSVVLLRRRGNRQLINK
jgi:hypothetical protein